MGLKFNLFKRKKKKVFVVGYDCGIDGWEFTEVVVADNFDKAIKYAEDAAVQLYEDMGLAPSDLKNDEEIEYESFAKDCLLNAIGFWCRDFDKKKDYYLIEKYGVIEI